MSFFFNGYSIYFRICSITNNTSIVCLRVLLVYMCEFFQGLYLRMELLDDRALHLATSPDSAHLFSGTGVPISVPPGRVLYF